MQRYFQIKYSVIYQWICQYYPVFKLEDNCVYDDQIFWFIIYELLHIDTSPKIIGSSVYEAFKFNSGIYRFYKSLYTYSNSIYTVGYQITIVTFNDFSLNCKIWF
ncbi:unnamed protein product [Paramecium pentaurelia]|uniref:Uncharacterized protein n=1 Tax=Paramecium pentaurelia TaxID=43138 RepID=A0A8S1WYC9_9CILI|nr:unnamed protein product [Paramecium pentaurelia]